MKIVIAGAGEVGTHLAAMLSKEAHDIIIIDPDSRHLSEADAYCDLLTIKGSATCFDVLNKSGVERADLYIAVTSVEEVNLISCIMAKELGAAKSIARVDNPEYLNDTKRQFFKKLGIDSVICPEKLAANEITNLLKHAGVTEISEFSGGKLSLFVVRLKENTPLISKTLREFASINAEIDFTVVAISRNGNTIIPRGDDVFDINDMVFIISNMSGIENILQSTGKEKINIHNVMILGGSRIGKKTAINLENELNIKIIEGDKNTCQHLAGILHKSLIINGDGTKIDLLKEEGIQNMDAFIAVTGNSETNILSCLLAKRMGVKETIAEVENLEYINLAENIGIDTIINKKLITASHIFQFTMNYEVSSIKLLTGADAELLEFIAKPGSPVTRKQIKDLGFPHNALIGGVIRGEQEYIAKGSFAIQPDDKVIVFTLPSAVKKVGKFFN